MILQWAFVPTGKVPHFRVQSIRMRLRLRLHPGHGFATAFAIWAHWGRGASYWASKRTRPALGRWDRLTHASAHSVFMGRAHYRMGLRLPIQEHLVVFGPPRAYKSGFFAHAIANHMGAVVSTSTKGDMVALTAGIRQHRGSPVQVFSRLRRTCAAAATVVFIGALALALFVLSPQVAALAVAGQRARAHAHAHRRDSSALRVADLRVQPSAAGPVRVEHPVEPRPRLRRARGRDPPGPGSVRGDLHRRAPRRPPSGPSRRACRCGRCCARLT